MIILLWFVAGICGLFVGILGVFSWIAVGNLFGVTLPTPEQAQGMMLLSGCLGVVISTIAVAVIELFDK